MATVCSEELGIPQLPGAKYPIPYMDSHSVLFTDLSSVGLHELSIGLFSREKIVELHKPEFGSELQLPRDSLWLNTDSQHPRKCVLDEGLLIDTCLVSESRHFLL